MIIQLSEKATVPEKENILAAINKLGYKPNEVKTGEVKTNEEKQKAPAFSQGLSILRVCERTTSW